MIPWLLLLLACAGRSTPCDLEGLVAQQAGSGAVDCGFGSVDDGDDAAVQACMATAFDAGERFTGIVQDRVPGGLIARGFVSDGVQVDVLVGDFWGCDDAGCYGQVARFPCETVAVGSDGASLVCTFADDAGCGEILCGGGTDCGT